MYTVEKSVISAILEYADKLQRKNTDGFKTEEKDGRDIVTDADKQIENFCISLIKKRFPNDGVISEESFADTVLPNKGRLWIIDPLDGTWNFACGIPAFAIQIAFAVDGEIVLSAINVPFGLHGREKYFAQKGEGAYMNGKRIFAKKQTEIKRAIVAVSDLSWNASSAQTELRIINELNYEAGRIRLLGSSAISFAYLASGRVDAYIGFDQKIWDILPGLLLAQEAGCVALGLDGNYYNVGDKDVICIPEKSGMEKLIFNKKMPLAADNG